ncbi:ABC transporter permease subunit [Actinoplanes sichuanensis]|uniref:ABC transporter permease subunit n=1 Tax=Actinoplanes sichuanensis TaxID=512349 RepID=A0ABW4AUM4_9ACTN|nr:ABC transporter permease subunit [Actinoplanes sichuanensis]BEL05253.1 ABC transporter permease subunit [Actinoplanes sichuanensis]
MNALRMEWTKFRTTPGSRWLAVAVVVVTVAGGAATIASVTTGDLAEYSLTGVQLSQAVVAVIAALVVGGEYRTDMIHTTLAAVPRRLMVLGAKAVVVAGVTAVSGAVSVAVSVLVGRAIRPALVLSDGAVLRAAYGSVLYLVLISLLAVGVAAIARDTAAAVGVVLGLLYVFTIVAQMVPDPDVRADLKQVAPMSAGLAIQATRDLADQPIAPWDGLGVLALWAAGSLLVGGVLLQRRDA